MDSLNKKAVGHRIKTLRKKAGETQSELGRVVGVTGSSIQQYEAGIKTPRDDIKLAIAKHYDQNVDNIFFKP